MPLLVLLITKIVEDQTPDDGEDGYDTSYPNIGKYGCFLSNRKIEGSNRPYYVATAHFLYFQLEVLILLFTNLILIGLSVLHIHEPFRQRIKLLRDQEKNLTEAEKKINLEEFKMCLFFFVITGIRHFIMIMSQFHNVTGLLWFFDLITSFIVGKMTLEEYKESCTKRFFLDLPWLSSVRIRKKYFFEFDLSLYRRDF